MANKMKEQIPHLVQKNGLQWPDWSGWYDSASLNNR